MARDVIVRSAWDFATGVLYTELSGRVNAGDVDIWRTGLHRELRKIPDEGSFKLLLNLHGFEPVDLEAHKAMRNVIPEVLASYGMRPVFLDLFPEVPPMSVTRTRGILCTAFANVHHDEEKMRHYEQRISDEDQRFFTTVDEAGRWLLDHVKRTE